MTASLSTTAKGKTATLAPICAVGAIEARGLITRSTSSGRLNKSNKRAKAKRGLATRITGLPLKGASKGRTSAPAPEAAAASICGGTAKEMSEAKASSSPLTPVMTICGVVVSSFPSRKTANSCNVFSM